MSDNTTDLNPIDGYLLELLGNYHRHLCPTCDGAENGCINCRHTGYNQTPCLICDKDGIAFKNRKDTLQKIEALISNREKLARIDELENGMLINTNSPSILTGYIHHRLSTLRKELDGGRDE